MPGSGRGEVADRQVGDLAVADRAAACTSGSAKPSWVRPERAYTSSVLATCASIVVAFAQRTHDLPAGRLARAGAARGRRRPPPRSPRRAPRAPGSRSRRNDTAVSWRRCPGATRSGSSTPRSAGSGRSVMHSTCGATCSSRWKRWSPFGSQSITRAPCRKASYLSFWSSVVLPEPSAPTLRIVALRSLSEPSRRLKRTGRAEPLSVWPR